MRLPLRASRAARTAVVAAAAALALGGCLHTDPTSAEPDDPTSASNVDTGDLAIRGLEVVLVADGAGADLFATIVNDGTTPDTLVSASIGGVPAQVEGDAAVAPGNALRLGDFSFSGGLRGQVTVSASGVEAVAGGTTPVQMGFASAPAVTVQVYVRDAADTAEGPRAEPTTAPSGEETPSLPPTETPSAPELPPAGEENPAGEETPVAPTPTP